MNQCMGINEHSLGEGGDESSMLMTSVNQINDDAGIVTTIMKMTEGRLKREETQVCWF